LTDCFSFPQTLFLAKKIETIVETGATFGIRMLLMIAAAKMVAVSCTTPVSGRIHLPAVLYWRSSRFGHFSAVPQPPDNRHDLHDGSSQCGH